MRRRTWHLLQAGALAMVMGASGCVAPAPPPPRPVPAPAPAPPSPPPPAAVQAPAPAEWMDAPQTPGDWAYRATADGTGAFFGSPAAEPVFALHCRTASHTVALIRNGAAAGPAPMTIRTETGDRALTAQPQAPGLGAMLSASDATLDAMAYSKGRFAVEVAGMTTLYLPAWPEVARVLEDCR